MGHSILLRLSALLCFVSIASSQFYDSSLQKKPQPFASRSFATKKPPPSQSSFYSAEINEPPFEEEVKLEATEEISAFLTRESRNTFIARVYGILTGQLLVTALSIFLFGLNPDLNWRILTSKSGMMIPIVSGVASLVSVLIMTFSTGARRSFPWNFVFLSLFTLGEAIGVGFVTSFYRFQTVMSAMVTTAVATSAISIYTIRQRNPKYDLTQWGAGLSACTMIFVLLMSIQALQSMGIMPTILPLSDAFFSFMGACFFSLYLAHHTKMIVGGKHAKYQMNEKDYVFGAVTLYSDIIAIFLRILEILSRDDDSSPPLSRRRIE